MNERVEGMAEEYNFFSQHAAATRIYTLSLHDALPISKRIQAGAGAALVALIEVGQTLLARTIDRKSTRLNSSHSSISYAVFCLIKKRTTPEDEIKQVLTVIEYISAKIGGTIARTEQCR